MDEYAVAQKILETVPLIMRSVISHMRHTKPQMEHSHFHLLVMLAHAPCTVSELAEKRAVSLPTMSNTLTTLEERQWVERTRLADDRRKVIIALAPAGQEVLANARHEMESHIVKIIDELSDDERQTILAGMELLKACFEFAFVDKGIDV